ncbi:MAG TPA: MMPL family transporter [Solirubrobacterales bacterium]|nr:MMPL family transporter [Solirubrobacterales bacterium]
MPRIAAVATRRSRLVVAIWVVLVCLIAGAGRNLEHELGIHQVFIGGTPSERAHEIAQSEFGSESALTVMLKGPPARVERQARRLAADLEARPHTLVVAPWSGGGRVDGLAPRPGVVGLIVRVEADESSGVTVVLPPVRRAIGEQIRAPVHAHVAGFPVLVDSLREATDRTTRLSEMIAVPVLLLVLLLVFRSVIAAVLPVVVGGAVVGMTRGLLAMLNHVVQLNLFVIGVVAMMGLALGVDYSLLVVSRYREERRKGTEPAEAARVTAIATYRSVVPAGCGLILAMLVAMLTLPGSTAQSVSLAVIAATLLSMASALCVVPALLTMLGDNLDRWALPMRRPGQSGSLRRVRRLADRPGAVVAIVTALVLLAGWAFTLDSGLANVAFLPPDDPSRLGQEEVEDELGPGWGAPLEVLVKGHGEPVTSTAQLNEMARFQRRVEADPGVATMAGLSQVARGVEGVSGIEGELAKQERGLDRLAAGIGKAHEGASQNTGGLRRAAVGSSRLEAGLEAAHGGAGALTGALLEVGDGSRQLSQGLGRVGKGSGNVAQGTSRASDGAGRIAAALGKAGEQTGELSSSARLIQNAMRSGEARLGETHSPLRAAEERLATAWNALQRMSAGRSDPEYGAALAAVEEANLRLTGKDIRTGETADPAYEGVGAEIERADGQFGVGDYLASRLGKSGEEASEGIEKLTDASSKLDRGLQRLAKGSRRVSDGVAALDRGGERLSPALGRLGDGAEHLSSGLSRLTSGAGELAGGLGQGAQRSVQLTDGLGRIESGLRGRNGESGLAQVRQRSPGIFRSSYFVLASLDGSPPAQRRQLGFLLNVNRGGTAARMLVIPREGTSTDAGRQTMDRVEADTARLARASGDEVVLGGVGPTNAAAEDATEARLPLMRLALSLVTLLVLIPVLRSLTVPLLAVLINLLTIAASFGILALLFDNSLLGGPGYVEAIVVPATMMVMFGLALDYEVFVFARIREEYVRTGSTRSAVSGGLDRTAHVVTGAALIMIAVFLSFSVSDFITTRNFGVAQAVAIALDAFVVRLIVVPAMMNLLGKWCWWLPKWLDRRWPDAARSRASAEAG